MQKTKLYLTINCIFIASILTSCFGVSHQTSSGGDKYVETFYLGDGNNQYFIKPMEFESDDESFKINFTIRNSDYHKQGGTANFSLYSDFLVENIDSLIIKVDKELIVTKIDRMFVEKDGSDFHLRCNFTCNKDFIELFFSTHLKELRLISKGKEFVLIPTSSTRTAINKINEDILPILNIK